MVRTLKFRAWDTERKQMLPVSNISFGDDGKALTVIAQTVPKGQYYHGLVDGENGVLMQYTGLKDKHGKDIYEGDIVLVGESDEKRFYPNVFIQWHFASWVLNSGLPGGIWSLQDRYVEQGLIEIIGNIYETPELSAQAKRRNR